MRATYFLLILTSEKKKNSALRSVSEIPFMLQERLPIAAEIPAHWGTVYFSLKMAGFFYLAAAFAATLVEITSGLYTYGGTSIYLLLGFSFLLNVISLWKYVALIDRINTMIGKIDFLSKGTRNLPERVQAVEFDFQKLSQSFDKVTDRIPSF